MNLRVSLFLLVAVFAAPAYAVELDKLYWAETVVTGTEEPERSRGFAIGLQEVLRKVTGTKPPNSPVLQRAMKEPAAYVAHHEYEDRMKGLPVRDEQGTRQRPHFLRMDFDRAKIDALVAELGLKKWTSDRSRLGILLGVGDANRAFVLASDSQFGVGQREVLVSASAATGVPIALPTEAQLKEAGLSPDDLARPTERLRRAVKNFGGDCLLLGNLRLARDGAYWDVAWQLDCPPSKAIWTLKQVSFDTALRGGLERSAEILAKAKPFS